MILRRLTDAEASGQNILGKILRSVQGSAGPREGTEEGAGRVYEAPSSYGMKRMFERAYVATGIPLDRVKYMGKEAAAPMTLHKSARIPSIVNVYHVLPSLPEFHATGTEVGDLTELEAVGAFFKVKFSSPKNEAWLSWSELRHPV